MTTTRVCRKTAGVRWDVYIGRPGKGEEGPHGNPVRIDAICPICGAIHYGKGATLPCYAAYLDRRLLIDAPYHSQFFQCRDKVLACWCELDDPCHGDIIISRLDRPEPTIVPGREPIVTFRGPYFFLSNFAPSPITWANEQWATVEHAYQAAKATRAQDWRLIRDAPTAAQAKSRSKHIQVREDWTAVKRPIMLDLLRHKFAIGSPLATRLQATGDRLLVEGNNWNDTYWGVCRGIGQNWLGILLMQVRQEIGATQAPVFAPTVQWIISGGQTGVDQAGLAAGQELGLTIGGWAPLGFRTERGQVPEAYRSFMREASSADYAFRTELNVRDSGAVVVITRGAPERGSKLTISLAQRWGRPCLHLDLDVLSVDAAVEQLKQFVDTHRPRVLDVAGNRESVSPGIEREAKDVLIAALKRT